MPGYFAADGNAANTSATGGNKWRVHLCPDYPGQWEYRGSFLKGKNIALTDNEGSPVELSEEIDGSFTVVPTDKTGRDMRAKGRLEYVGKHYLQFAGNHEYFLKQGADAPENLLAYEDFDGEFKSDGNKDELIKSWQAHAKDWKKGDPYWQDNKGTELIGAINYLASEGLNAFSFITMNINGDDRNVFPYTDYNERYRMDCSRLDQWETIFEHADKMGMFLHFKTMETENEMLLDNGDLGEQRKLYYRELIARFGHHLALNWNLGEEINNASTEQKKAWAEYFYHTDPYHHHIVIHNMGYPHYDLLGPDSKLTGFSLQTNHEDFREVFDRVKDYIDRSDAAGKPWAVACDEPGDARHALRPDNDAGNSHVDARRNALWATFMAGGWGNEWYFGYHHAHSDLSCQDFRSRDQYWDYCRYALQFFSGNDNPARKTIPVQNMKNTNQLVSGANRCLSGLDDSGKPCFVIQAWKSSRFEVELPKAKLYNIGWMDSTTGQWITYPNDNIVNHDGGKIGFTAPSDSKDWILLLYDWNKQEASKTVKQPNDINAVSPSRQDWEMGGVYIEKDGIVVIEAENTETTELGFWQVVSVGDARFVDGATNGKHLEFTSNTKNGGKPESPLTYRFMITKPGVYQMHIRSRKRLEGEPGDKCNDCYVRMEGDFESGSGNYGTETLKKDTKLYGGEPEKWGWAYNLDGNGADHKPVFYNFKKGQYTLTISGRSIRFNMDRIVLHHKDVEQDFAKSIERAESKR